MLCVCMHVYITYKNCYIPSSNIITVASDGSALKIEQLLGNILSIKRQNVSFSSNLISSNIVTLNVTLICPAGIMMLNGVVK